MGGLEATGVLGPSLLRDRGDEKVRSGLGRGVFSKRSLAELELEDEDITEAFLLRSAKDTEGAGPAVAGDGEGEGEGDSTVSIEEGGDDGREQGT